MADNSPNLTDQTSLKDEHESTESEDPNGATPKSNVRRRLDFGPGEVDENSTLKFQSDDQDKERRRTLEKWNFDFENEVPLAGDWEWEKVTPVEPVPKSKDVLVSIKDKTKGNRNI